MTWTIHNAGCFDGLKKLKPKSVHCACASPPYLGLRDYGIPPRTWADGSVCVFGLEPSIELYVAHTVELFAELGRVLRDDGCIWWNIGDSYSQDSKWGGWSGNKNEQKQGYHRKSGAGKSGLLDKQKMLIPHRVAIGLQAAGWIVRQDNVWAKKSPMTESLAGWQWKRCRVKVATARFTKERGQPRAPTTNDGHRDVGKFSSDENKTKWKPCPGCDKCSTSGGWVLRRGSWRNTTSHEVIFQIVKSASYFSDSDAAAEPTTGGTHSRGSKMQPPKEAEKALNGSGHGGWASMTPDVVETRNPRSVWTLSSESYKGAHFATFPTELVRRCLVASCSKCGCCPACGSQYAPMITKERVPTRPGTNSKVNNGSPGDIGYRARDKPDSPYHGHSGSVVGNRDPQRHIQRTIVHGYRPTCECNAGEAVPPTVLDPFSGSGTTLQVAHHMGFDAIGFEQNPAYIELAKERIATVPRCLLPKAERKKSKRTNGHRQPTLFS